MFIASHRIAHRSRILAINLILLLMFFIFTTFITDRKISHSQLAVVQNITGTMPEDNLQQSLDNLIPYVDFSLQSSVSEDIMPGAAIAIVYDGKVRFLKTYGVKKEGSSEPIDIHTVFRLGSVSKGFASVLTGIMTHENVIRWDDPVASCLPDFHHIDTSNFNQVTIRNILSQSSGFPIHTFTDLLDENMPYRLIIQQLQTVPFSTKPGTTYSYQNVVYSLIDNILTNKTGKEYAYLLREKILFPLHMQDASSEFVSLIMSGNYAYPHIRKGNSWKPVDNNPRYYASAPASGINASISDMAQWLLALTGSDPEVIAPGVLEEVFQPEIEIPMKRSIRRSWDHAEKLFYALGWRVIEAGGKTIVFHGGLVEGFRAEIGFCPDDKVGIVMLFNSNSGAINHIMPEFFDDLYRYNASAPFFTMAENI